MSESVCIRICTKSEVILLDTLMPSLLCPGNAFYCGDANMHAKFGQSYIVHMYVYSTCSTFHLKETWKMTDGLAID